MTRADRKRMELRIEDIEHDARRASDESVRSFLRRKVGRWPLATLLGDEHGKNVAKADAYLYQKRALNERDQAKVRECYLAALIVNEIRFFAKGGEKFDKKIARNWLMVTCPYLEDHAPICAIRDGKTYGHLSAVGAAKTFVLGF